MFISSLKIVVIHYLRNEAHIDEIGFRMILTKGSSHSAETLMLKKELLQRFVSGI